MKVALLTAGKDPHYALGLAPALARGGVDLEVVGNTEMKAYPGLREPRIRFFDLRGDQSADASAVRKIRRVLAYYFRLIRFAWTSDSRVFHVLWHDKFLYFDRTLLELYYRLLGRRLVYTAHNVNTEARDRRDSFLNRLTLRFHYALTDHVFVHTRRMRDELVDRYGVAPERISVIKFPVNDVTPRTGISAAPARSRLGLSGSEKILLFFGNIAGYKGLEDLIRAVPALEGRIGEFRVVVAGSVKAGEQRYFEGILNLIEGLDVGGRVSLRVDYIPESEVELYFEAADLLVLPYRRIFQSGILLLSWGFGLPVVASDAGSLADDVVEGRNGFVFRTGDPGDLARRVLDYFESGLYADLAENRGRIAAEARASHSWEQAAGRIRQVYEELTGKGSEPVSIETASE
jgi:glycosyltransferase involved in cell wall biosynthesis